MNRVQSNAEGSGLTADFADVYQTPRSDIKYWAVGGAMTGFPRYHWDLETGSTAFDSLALGTGNTLYAATSNYAPGTRSGCEVPLGHELKRLMPDSNIAIIKHGVSGTGLARGSRSSLESNSDTGIPDPGGDWDTSHPFQIVSNPDGSWTDDSGDGLRYHVFMEMGVKKALKALTDAGDTYEVSAMFWIQGEQDSNSTAYANAYGNNLKRLIASVRDDAIAPEMRFLTLKIQGGGNKAGVNGGMDATATADPEKVFSINPLTPFNADFIDDPSDSIGVLRLGMIGEGGDNVHYNSTNLTKMGKLFARLFVHQRNK